MADAPWVCSACGTINEPVANSCRNCGRWPSLFDLEASTVDPTDIEEIHEPVYQTTYEPEPVDVRGEIPLEPEDVLDPDPELEPEVQAPQWRRILTSAIVPIAFAVYLLISLFFNDQS